MTVKSNSSLNDKFLIAIGQIVAESGYLEQIVQNTIWEMAQIVPGHGAAITAHMGLMDKVRALMSLSDYIFRDTPIDKELRPICNDILNNVIPERNKIVHNAWQPSTDFTAMRTRILRARGEVKLDEKIHTIETLEKLRSDISNATQRVFAAAQKLEKVFEQARRGRQAQDRTGKPPEDQPPSPQE